MKTLTHDGQDNFGVCIAMLVLATLAVSLRFAVRFTTKIAMASADYLCLVALVFFAGYTAAMLHYIVNGPGHGEFDLGPLIALQAFPQLTYLFKILFVTEIMITMVLTAIKISILSFYYSIFQISQKFRLAVRISGTICIAWCIAFGLVIIFQCHPVDALWNQLAPADRCIPTPQLLLSYEITNLFVDVLILCLPIGMLQTLKLPRYRKASVAGMFLLGSFVCIASILRLKYIWVPGHSEEPNLPMVMVWSTVQQGVAIVCSCLPTYAPLFRKAKPVLRTLGSNFRSSQQNNSNGTKTSAMNVSIGESSDTYRKLGSYEEQPSGITRTTTVHSDSYPLSLLGNGKVAMTRLVRVDNGDDQVPLWPLHDAPLGLQGRGEHFASASSGGRRQE